MKLRLLLILLAASAMSAGPASRAIAQLEGDKELLRQAAMQHQENRERIETWQGKVILKNNRIDEHQSVQLASEAKFYWANEGERLRWEWSAERRQDKSIVVKRRNSPPGAVDAQGRLFLTGIATDGRLHLYTNVTTAGMSVIEMQPKLRTKRLDDDLIGRRTNIGFFSPMWHVIHCGDGVDVERRVMHYFETADDPLNFAVVSLDDDLLTVSVKHPRTDLFAEYRYDLAKQGNVVKMRNGDANAIDSHTYTWEQVDGVWVPKTLHREFRKMHGPSAPLTLTEEVEWTENRVNEPIDANLFDIESLELLPDTRRINEITGQSDPNTPPPGTPVSTLETPSGTASSNLRILLIANMLVALLILGVVAWRKFLSRQGRTVDSAGTTCA